ncbi:type II toxin-antitoxin system HicB family antitoxin [Chroococcidiopsis sp. CCMEE 29]|uniref:type II toxin-antitoxin system HicB family antitoxin n=1 Tax=Chroococcidiopsis sp. CCMEE 29 TaxID=155894 RepID=UPI00202201FE|nr:type II toxin-antitoxin system HicB family antitoxin [Chroococcidiopsis sp. CCMEE 29]
MLTEYIKAAMHRAKYEILDEDSTFIGKIPECQGVWANADTLEACRDELQEVLEEWIILGFQMGHPLPAINGIDLSIKKEEAA